LSPIVGPGPGTSQQSWPAGQHCVSQQSAAAPQSCGVLHGGVPQVPAAQNGFGPAHFFPQPPQLAMSFIALPQTPPQHWRSGPQSASVAQAMTPLPVELAVVVPPLELEVVVAAVVLVAPVPVVLACPPAPPVETEPLQPRSTAETAHARTKRFIASAYHGAHLQSGQPIGHVPLSGSVHLGPKDGPACCTSQQS
jgi:hypothetical protein